MEKISVKKYKSPVGELILGAFYNELCICDWTYRKQRDAIDSRIKKYLKSDFIKRDEPILNETIAQLEEYFSANRKKFDLPLLPIGSAFQQEVWHELQKIEYGQTFSYKALAERMNSPLAIRAIAAANGANALAIIIPCHRIIGSNNKLVGYAGGLKTKRKLLELESALPLKQQFSLF